MRRDRCSTVRVPVKKNGPILLDTASVRLCCVENITRGAVETSYLYIRMGHTTYMHLNDTYRVPSWVG